MRNIWVMSFVVMAAGCGISSQPWDKNKDGLVSQCEGLDRFFCELAPGCQGQTLACLAICRDDGKGGCGSPCPDDFQCVPKLPAPPSCALVPINSCAAIPACEVQTLTVCTAGSGGGHPGAPETDPAKPSLGCGGGCTSTQVCANKAPATCESLPISSCNANPACEVEFGAICAVYCAPGSVCPPCATPKPSCVPRTTPTCESLSVSSCNANPACEVQSGPVCKIACMPGSPCPPCATPQLRCAPRPFPSCETLSLAQCTSAAGCMIESAACPAVCEDDGKGGCKPCPGPASICVPLHQPKPEPAPAPPGTK